MQFSVITPTYTEHPGSLIGHKNERNGKKKKGKQKKERGETSKGQEWSSRTRAERHLVWGQDPLSGPALDVQNSMSIN